MSSPKSNNSVSSLKSSTSLSDLIAERQRLNDQIDIYRNQVIDDFKSSLELLRSFMSDKDIASSFLLLPKSGRKPNSTNSSDSLPLPL